MLALTVAPSQPGGLGLQEVDEPQPGPGEALVEVRAVSLNRGEVRRLSDQPEGVVPGWDVAGTVVEQAADDSGPPAGARVVGLVQSGGWARHVAVPTDSLAQIPDGLALAAAATLPVAGLTAYRTLALGGLLLGKRVLVTGGAGGVGRLAVQLAHRGGAHVTAVVGRPERGEGLEALGADEVVVGLEEEGPGLDHVLESVGGASLAAAVRRVTPHGMVACYGNSSGEPVTLSARDFYRGAYGARLQGFFLFADIAREPASGDLGLLASLMAGGALDPQIDVEVSWQQPEEALAALMDRRVNGKAVLHVD
ncbi:MAG: zinc-binding dehydrogenase [Actinomycetota bacterium]|nr:zinc-binding dehydrogenase [Actinomycetota bacterium]